MRFGYVWGLILLVLSWLVGARADEGDTKLVFPVIKDVGGVVPMPKATDQPRKGAKLVLDLTGEAEPGEVHKGLKRAALVLNLYGAAGLKPTDVQIAIVLHGKATRCCLNDAAYAKRTKAERNPNLPCDRRPAKSGGASGCVWPSTKLFRLCRGGGSPKHPGYSGRCPVSDESACRGLHSYSSAMIEP